MKRILIMLASSALLFTAAPVVASAAPHAVHPGSFCAQRGATGRTTLGTRMICGPASDQRLRWHHR